MVYLWAFFAVTFLILLVISLAALSRQRHELIVARAHWQELQHLRQTVSSAVAQAQSLHERYGKIANLDVEATRLKVEISDYAAKKRELAQMEEDLSSIEVGLYKPHFEWTDSAQYRNALEVHYKKHKHYVKAGMATRCNTSWSVSGSEKEGQRLTKDLSKLMLRAFNAECEAAISKVRWNNFEVMKRRIEKAYDTINKLVSRWQLSLTHDYLSLWLEELVLSHEYKETLEREREEQRALNERIREEARAQKELERAQRDAEESERVAEQALTEAKRLLESARAEDATKYQNRISELEAALAEAHARKERAISMAQLTRCGFVYVVSNIGSFGEDVFKIGMTRREDPNDRIRELGDASVPFYFDVHAMVYSDDAPRLESDLHRIFASRRLNLVNERKEFFNVSLSEIANACNQLGLKLELTMLAEAREYRQSKAMREARMAANQRSSRPVVTA